MKCHRCCDKKLSNEFPFFPLTEDCDHALLHCLDCAIESVKKYQMCSLCEIRVTEDNVMYKEYLEALEFLFPNEENEEIPSKETTYMLQTGNLYITTMSGESLTLTYYQNKRISDLKKEVQSGLKTEPEKQRLLYQNKELKVYSPGHGAMTLKDYNIPPNSTLHLIVVLCAVPDDLDEVVFDFCWGLPYGRSRDYLDVSVFAYSGTNDLGTIYYRNRSLMQVPGVEHSGPAYMGVGEGRQRVNVNLQSIPQHIDKIVFTLSAWGSSNISKYPYYRLKFYDRKFPDQQLCNDKVDAHLLHHRSIIMCSL
ncbi:uncharacterized protein LOC124448712 [Xenia sp. Carnegie-2017]|uniref:uncharacterized protein LOC124448712 n=1 Tax=Xenia sp. Carnegie-2017 TaxID=2897299 RepID=UPI001F0502DE|nr:uncharacterized protein LOC124448712 [Xenia sp. Carnegie-2017]